MSLFLNINTNQIKRNSKNILIEMAREKEHTDLGKSSLIIKQIVHLLSIESKPLLNWIKLNVLFKNC